MNMWRVRKRALTIEHESVILNHSQHADKPNDAAEVERPATPKYYPQRTATFWLESAKENDGEPSFTSHLRSV
jgi:hypothetical protein